jgi:hypothetical protein
MTIRSYLIPFAIGFAAGFALGRNWDDVREAVAPVARRVARRASGLLGRGREVMWDQREKVEDLLAGMREKEALRAAARPGVEVTT